MNQPVPIEWLIADSSMRKKPREILSRGFSFLVLPRGRQVLSVVAAGHGDDGRAGQGCIGIQGRLDADRERLQFLAELNQVCIGVIAFGGSGFDLLPEILAIGVQGSDLAGQIGFFGFEVRLLGFEVRQPFSLLFVRELDRSVVFFQFRVAGFEFVDLGVNRSRPLLITAP